MALLLLDLDDTLTDRRASFRAWALAFCAEHGLPQDAGHVLVELDADGYTPRPAFFAQAVERFALADASPEDLLSRFRSEFATYTRGPSERSVALLEGLRGAGWRIAVVTNGDANQARKIEAADLARLLDAVLISEIEGVRKPDRAIFERAAKCCGVSLSGGWMVGDHPEFDILGAAQCGLSTIWLRHGRAWHDPSYTPTLAVDNLEQALERLCTQPQDS